MKREERPQNVSAIACVLTMAGFVAGLAVLAMQLKVVQVDAAPGYNYEKDRQSIRRVQTAGMRGRILDAKGRVLAGNRICQSVVCNPAAFQRKTWNATAEAIMAAAQEVSAVVGRPVPLSARDIRRHVDYSLSMPLYFWRDLNDEELARFIEHADERPGFSVVETEERIYPEGDLAPHAVGYVGRDRGDAAAGDVKFSFSEQELRGRAGLEFYYDSFLRGVPGERNLLVDARGFAVDSWEVTAPGRGPDLVLTLDADIQRAARRQLAGLRGACVVMDPRNGAVLALVSAPDYDLNALVPTMRADLYARMTGDAGKPLLNRATAGSYAPGSTFKPVTAMAGLELGYPVAEQYCCFGVFEFAGMKIHCARRWGHGYLSLREALRDSCNTFFCNLGCEVGSNQLCKTARAFGLGSKTGIDTPDEVAGVVPDHEWKMRTYGERWYPGDLAQMAIGQGMLLASPLQMACVAGAFGTGRLVTPRLRRDASVAARALPFEKPQLDIVREGMRMVVEKGGTGVKGAQGVNAWMIGKTGTAEVGIGENRRKNTWFIAYAESCGHDGEGNVERVAKPAKVVAVAMVIENGMSGGGTTAPRVAEVLKGIFGSTDV